MCRPPSRAADAAFRVPVSIIPVPPRPRNELADPRATHGGSAQTLRIYLTETEEGEIFSSIFTAALVLALTVTAAAQPPDAEVDERCIQEGYEYFEPVVGEHEVENESEVIRRGGVDDTGNPGDVEEGDGVEDGGVDELADDGGEVVCAATGGARWCGVSTG